MPPKRSKLAERLGIVRKLSLLVLIAGTAMASKAVNAAAPHRMHSVEEVEANNNWRAERIVRAELKALTFLGLLFEADLPVLLIALFIFFITVALTLSFPELVALILMRLNVRERLARLVWAVLFVGTFGVGSLTALSVFDVELASLLQMVGFFGIVLSYGLGAIIANIVSGLLLPFFAPIEVGKRVRVEQAAGVVEFVSLRHTAVLVTSAESGKRQRAWVPNHDFDQYVTWEELGDLAPAEQPTESASSAKFNFHIKDT